MRYIVRYNNRKLYDKDAARYTNHAELLQWLQAGEVFHVSKHGTGEDITGETIVEVLYSTGCLHRLPLVTLVSLCLGRAA